MWSGKGQGKIIFLKMMLDSANCRYVIFVSLNIKNQANLQLALNIQKLEVFRLQGALPPDPSTRTFVVCMLLY